MSLGSTADAIANQATRRISWSQKRCRAKAALPVVLERPYPEVLDFVRGRARKLREHTIERAAQHAPQQVERRRRDRSSPAARTRTAERAALIEIEGDELGVFGSCRFAAAGAVVEHGMEPFER